MTHELTTCLWYDGKAKEAAELEKAKEEALDKTE